jgi:alpha-glucoside transport system permease protein
MVDPERTTIAPGRAAIALVLLALTFLGLYVGFVWLRDGSANGVPHLATAFIAIIWGVGGVAALFFVANYAVETLPGKWTTRIQPYIFIGPAVLLMAWYLAAPAVRTFAASLYDKDGVSFIGLQNYVDVFSQRSMIEAWRNNILWFAVGTTFTVGFGLIIAVLADRSRFEKTAKSLIFLPMAISMVGAGVIWKFVFDVNPNIGLINAITTSSGGTNQDWLRLVQPWNNLLLIVVMVWLQTGFAMVLLSAAIKGIPEDLLEAGRIDGASEPLIFFRIIIPNISGTLITVITTTVIFTLKVFDIVQVMTGGNFGTEVIGVRFYREEFTIGNQGLAAAIAIVLLVAVVPVMIYNLRQFARREAF